MIELKNITKIYKSKKGEKVTALNDISLTFDNKGMTFILGKSGSGKSTLLNVIGGLDKYDSGDMIILGKSSKEFKQSDFDCYRNTYVGFVFQEFNVFEDFALYINIMLSLHLQQKEINEEEIDKLLKKLDLFEIKKRKINELSGGQKQRVAIARALIKKPKIILADEPTGNLDSKTGKQVMELLKEISKETLVIVVSHDEKSATQYGDRVITIKDGKIDNDTQKNKKYTNIKNDYKIINSNLPFKTSFKLGIKSLTHKKIKLFFAIILTSFTLVFLGCTNTLLNFNEAKEHAKLLKDNKDQFVQIEKRHYTDNLPIQLVMDDDTMKKITDKYGKGYDVYKYYEDEIGFLDIFSILHISGSVNEVEENYVSIVPTSDISKIAKGKLIGRNATSSNEIVISKEIADLIVKQGIEVHELVGNISHTFKPKTIDEILNTKYTYYFGSLGSVKIVGIFEYDMKKVSNLYRDTIYVSNDFINNLKTPNTSTLNISFDSNISISDYQKPYDNDISVLFLKSDIVYFDGNNFVKRNSLKENEVVLNLDLLLSIDESDTFYDDRNNYVSNFLDYETGIKKFYSNYIKDKGYIGRKVTLDICYGDYSEGQCDMVERFDNLVVVGVYVPSLSESNDEDIYYSGHFFSAQQLDKYKSEPFQKYSILYPMTEQKDFEKTLNDFPYSEHEFGVKTSYSNQVENFKDFYLIKDFIIDFIRMAFYVDLVFLVFTIILITNFMFNSVSYRKKEIGILRALGSKNTDVLKIFLWEGIVITLISGIIGSYLLILVTNFLNSYFDTVLPLFNAHIMQFIFIFAVVFAITFISSVLPILKITRMKPIDAILNK